MPTSPDTVHTHAHFNSCACLSSHFSTGPDTCPRASHGSSRLYTVSRFLCALTSSQSSSQPTLDPLPWHAPPLTAAHTPARHLHSWASSSQMRLWSLSCLLTSPNARVPPQPPTLTKLFPPHASGLRAAQLNVGTACPLGSSTPPRRPGAASPVTPPRPCQQEAPTRVTLTARAALSFTRLIPVLVPVSSRLSLPSLIHPAACSPLMGPAQLRAGLLCPRLPPPPPSPPRAETFPHKRGSTAYLVGPRILQKQTQSLRTELWAWGEGRSSAHTPLHPTAACHGRRLLLCPQPSEQDGAASEFTHPTSSTRLSLHSRVSAPPEGWPGEHPGS